VSQTVAESRCVVVLFGTSLSEYTLLNASRTVANNYRAKFFSRMSTRSSSEYALLTPAQIMCSWSEQWPGNQGHLDPTVADEFRGV
jgi:hypothetical protein